MDKFDKMLKELKALEDVYSWEDDIPEKLYDKYFGKETELVAEALDVEKHRWYEVATDVYRFDDRYLGIREVADVFSEMMEVRDCFYDTEFFEMEAIESITYKPLKTP